MDARYIRDYGPIYRVLGNLGAVGAGIMANRYQVSENRVKTSLGGKGYSFSYPKKYKKEWETMYKRKSQFPPTPPLGNKRRARVTAKQARRRAVASAQKRLLKNYPKVAKVRGSMSKTNKYLKSKPQINKSTGGAYAGAVGRTYKLKKSAEYKILQQGAVRNIEFKGVSSTSTESIYLGHSSYTGQFLVVQFWMALLKTFMIKVGYPIIDFNDAVPADIVGDFLVFRFKDNYLDGAATSHAITITTGSWFYLASVEIRNYFINKNNQFQLVSVELVPRSGSPFKFTRMWCKNAYVMVNSKSTFTVQNRTPPAVDVKQQDVIDNQPLKATIYYGNGNGTQMRNVQDAIISEYVPGDSSGVIDVIPTLNALQEPPEGHYFAACRRVGAFYLDPGQTKKSTHVHNKWMSISTFFSLVLGPERSNNTKSLIKMGNFKLFGFEKIVDCVQAQPDINIGFEHNLRIGMIFKAGSNVYTNALYNSQYK